MVSALKHVLRMWGRHPVCRLRRHLAAWSRGKDAPTPSGWKPDPNWFSTAAILLVLFFAALSLQAQTSPYTPYQHKALYLFNFAKYTEWPPDAFADENAPFVLGILGNDPFKSDIDIIRGKTIKGRKLEIRYYHSVLELTGCHLLFICSSETNNLPQILKALEHSRILTIAEAEGFIEQKGMINLVTEQKSTGSQVVNFEINQTAAREANLKLDTQLLKLAKRKS